MEVIYIECPICEKNKLLVKLHDFEESECKIVKCEECRLVFVSPNLSKEEMKNIVSKDFFIAPSHQELIDKGKYSFPVYLENVSNEDITGYPNYLEPEHLNAKISWGNRIMGWLKLGYRREFGREAKPNSLLEVGGATGHMSKSFVDAGWSPVVVTELSDWCKEYNDSKEGLGLDMRVANPEDLEGLDNTFDAVMLWDTLEHLQYPVKSLDAIYRMTSASMIGVIQCPDADEYITEKEHHLISLGQHCFHFNHYTLGLILEKCGFKICGEKVSPEAGEMVILFTKQ